MRKLATSLAAQTKQLNKRAAARRRPYLARQDAANGLNGTSSH